MGSLECRGRPIGVSIMLEDGVTGFINRKSLSDENSYVDELLENLKHGQNIICRIMSFNPEKYSCELSCKSTDLQQSDSSNYDIHFNYDRETKDKQSLITATEKNTVKTNFTKRVISHQSFHNVTHTDAERMLSTMSQVIIRQAFTSDKILNCRVKPSFDHHRHRSIIWLSLGKSPTESTNTSESKRRRRNMRLIWGKSCSSTKRFVLKFE
jgi:predicted RNA-binding protein with RPS1 domain